MALFLYRQAGLSVSSSIELPEWTGFRACDTHAPADVRICTERGELDATLADHQPVVNGDALRFQIAGTAAYTLTAGAEIRVRIAPGAAPREVRLFILGTAWGALAHLGWTDRPCEIDISGTANSMSSCRACGVRLPGCRRSHSPVGALSAPPRPLAIRRVSGLDALRHLVANASYDEIQVRSVGVPVSILACMPCRSAC